MIDSNATDLLPRDYAPRTVPRLPDSTPDYPRFPVIDAHNHLGTAFGPFSGDWPARPVSELVATLDESGVQALVDLDGQWGDTLKYEIARHVSECLYRYFGAYRRTGTKALLGAGFLHRLTGPYSVRH